MVGGSIGKQMDEYMDEWMDGCMERKEGRNALKSMRRGEEEEKEWKKEMGQKGSGNERKVEMREK